MEDYTPYLRAAVRRTGLIHESCVEALAALMAASEGVHPKQIARQFRQTGIQLSRDEKRALGLRSNTDMSREALDALTDKGRQDPLLSLMNTLLDAYFGFARAYSVRSGQEFGHDRFRISAYGDCAGCKRLNGQIVTGEAQKQIPPDDCERDACWVSMALRIDWLANLE